MSQARPFRGSGFRSRPLAPEVEEAPRPSGPSKVVLSASRALARRVEDSQPFTRENVELHWKDREATRFDFYFNLQTLKVEDAADRRPESQLTYPARLARLTSKPATPATPSTRATASPSSRLTTPQTPRKTPTSPDSRCSVEVVIKQKNASSARRARMQELQRGIIDHDEERLADIARGTSPLLGARGQAMLPVPPVEVDPLRMPMELRLRLAVGNKISKSFRRPWLMAAHAAVEEARDLPLQHAVLEAFEDTRSFDVAHPRPEGPQPLQEYAIPRRVERPKDLLLQAEEFQAILEDRCMPLAWQFLSVAYDATASEVLKMLRHVHIFEAASFTAVARKELEQIADELLHSLTSRLKDMTSEFLLEVLATMKQCNVGSTAFSDLLAQLLAQKGMTDIDPAGLKLDRSS